jgi:hypothetical protein
MLPITCLPPLNRRAEVDYKAILISLVSTGEGAEFGTRMYQVDVQKHGKTASCLPYQCRSLFE